MASCSWAVLRKESAFKVPVAGTVVGTDLIVLELLDDDPVNVESVPTNEQLYSWLACGDADRAIGETETISGTLRTLLYPDQAKILLGWAYQPIDQSVALSEIPWVTSEPPSQFASMAMDFAYRDDAGVERKNRFLGGKVTGATLTAARGTRDGAFVLELEITFSERTTTIVTAPAAADYPNGAPYFLSATSGGLEVNAVTLSDYESLTITGAYTTTTRFDESPTLRSIRHHRKDWTMELSSLLKFNPDFRALRDNRSTFPAELTMSYPGGTGQQEILWDFGGNCRVGDDGWQRQLPVASDRTQTLTIMSQYDRVADSMLEILVGTQV